jgi:hypothetical protein
MPGGELARLFLGADSCFIAASDRFWGDIFCRVPSWNELPDVPN